MKTVLFLCSIFCLSLLSEAQETGGYTNLISNAPDIPRAETFSTTSIAGYINRYYKTEIEKLSAAYSWVASNISYDTDSIYVINSEKTPDTKITGALRRRKGVCENFAAIFNDIANKCNIASYEVAGYTKQNGTIDKTGHTWCAVFYNNEWLFCDPTWDAGFNNYARYFLVKPTVFIQSHMPFDPLWQLLDHTVSHEDFYSGNIYPKKNKPLFNFSDSVNAYLDMSEQQQLESTSYRIRQAGIPNELVKARNTYINMKISILVQDKIMNLYNAAVELFNSANNILNDFINFRNNRFMPLKPEKDIYKMISPADLLLQQAYNKIAELETIPDNFQYDPGILKNRLDVLSGKLDEQKEFIKKYFSANTPEREHLFYK